MADKYRIVSTESENDERRYYASREMDTGQITWTEKEIEATIFETKRGAENVLRILEDMYRARHVYHVLMEIEKAEERKSGGKAALGEKRNEKNREENPKEENSADPVKENDLSEERMGSKRSTFLFGKIPPLNFFIKKNEAGDRVYRFTDETGKIRAVGTGAEEGKDVAKAYCVYACQLMEKAIDEDKRRREK